MPKALSRLLGRFGRRESPPRPERGDADLERFYTDAEEARLLFEQLVVAEQPSRPILVIHGAGAVGKSSLLMMYRLFCHRKEIPVALVGGEEAPSAVDLLDRLATDLGRDGVELPTFGNSLDHYRKLRAKVETEALKAGTLQTDAAGQLTKATARGIAAAAGAIPVAGSVVAAVGPEAIEGVLTMIRATLSQADYDFFIDPTKRLTDDYLVDIGRAAKRRRLVLMIDTFEQMTALGDWLRDVVQRLPENAIVVVAGKEIPEWDREWPGWVARREAIELTEMSDEHVETLVRQYYALFGRGEPDDEFVHDVVQFARGLPMAATTAVRLRINFRLADFEPTDAGIAAELADRLLDGVPSELQPAFEAAALLRYFNADSLEALLDDADGSALYDELRRWPFTRARREGLAVHETMREVINAALRARSPEGFRRLQERAARHYERLLSHTGGEEQDRLALEFLYHSLRADEAVGLRGFRERAEGLVRAQWIGRLRALVNDALTWPLDLENSRLWRRYYATRLEQLVGRSAANEAEYLAIGNSDDAEPTLRAYAFCDLGAILAGLDRLAAPNGEQDAVAAVQRSLELQPELDSKLVANHITLMNISNARADWEESIEHVRAAREFADKTDDAYGLIAAARQQAALYGLQGDWSGYLRMRGQYLDVTATLGDVPALRMQVTFFTWPLVFMGRYAEARASSEEALEIALRLEERELMITIRESVGLALGMQEAYEKATTQFDEAYDFYESFHLREAARDAGSPVGYTRALLSFRGLVALREGKLDRAEADLQRALEVKREIGDRIGTPELQVWRGQLRELRHTWEQAEAEYGEVLQLRQVQRHYFHCAALAGLARVYFATQRSEECGPLLAEATELARRFEYNDLLASIRLCEGHIALHRGEDGLAAALTRYQEALLYALCFNRFLLDEVLAGRPNGTPLQPVIPACLERGSEGRHVLSSLREWWAGGETGEACASAVSPLEAGVPLLEAERTARAREPGTGRTQPTIVEQIESALGTA